MYLNLALGRTTETLAGRDLKDLLLLIADQPDGFGVALEILYMRLHSDRSAQRERDPELMVAGRELLRGVQFRRGNSRADDELAEVARACLTGPDAALLAAEVASKLRQAVAAHETSSFDNGDLLRALLAVQPTAVLDALFEGGDGDQRAGVRVFHHFDDHQVNPADGISCEKLIGWCNQNSERRYALAASFVTFVRRTSKKAGFRSGRNKPRLSLRMRPIQGSVLTVFVERFRPRSWERLARRADGSKCTFAR